MQSIIQNLVFGLFVGSIYGIGAVGLALVFGVLKILNVEHGEFVMLGGCASFLVVQRIRIVQEKVGRSRSETIRPDMTLCAYDFLSVKSLSVWRIRSSVAKFTCPKILTMIDWDSV